LSTYVYVWRAAVSEAAVDYYFSPADGVVGVMRIERVTGDMHLVEPCPGDDTNTWYQCACKAVWNHWAAGGKLPESTGFRYD
jgi:hypothetical protein